MSRHAVAVWTLRVVTVAVGIGLWLYGNGPGDVSILLLPRLGNVLDQFWSLLGSSDHWHDVLRTLEEIVIAGAIAAVTGMAVGFAVSRSRFRVAVVEPLLAWGYMVPLILFYPVFILWFGVGMWSKIGYAAVSAFFPIAYNSVRAFSGVDPRYLRVGVAFGASRAQIDTLIKFRAAIPVVAAGLRIGAATTFITVIVAEMLASQQGLGYELAQTSQTFERSTSFAIILFVLLLVGVFQFLVSRALPNDHGGRRRPTARRGAAR
jgi:NitT/TauT family transport system permease protein